MSRNIFTEAIAENLENIKSILQFRPKVKLDKAWDLALGNETSLGCWWYEVKDGKFEYSDKTKSHTAGIFKHIWQDLKRRRWIRGHIFDMGNRVGVLIHIEDFLGKDAPGSVLADMVRKVTEVTGYPVHIVADEQGRLWGKA